MIDRITNYIRAGYSGLCIVSHEESRVEAAVVQVIESLNKTLPKNTPDDPHFELFAWSLTEGLLDVANQEVIKAECGPDEVLDLFLKAPARSVYLLRDFHLFTEDKNPMIWRKLHDGIAAGKAENKTLILLGCRLALPSELEKQIVVLDFLLPDKEQLRATLHKLVKGNGIKAEDVDEESGLLAAAAGLTVGEAEQAFGLSYIETKRISKAIVFREKCQAVRKNGMLEVVDSKITLDSIGGLENLKKWLLERKEAFSDEAAAYGLPTPRGVLCVGNPGCLHPDAPIYDPVDLTTKTVKERHTEGVSFHVVSMSTSGAVIAAADAPWAYPKAEMVKLTFSDSNSITVTLGHRLLTLDGWLTAAECSARLQRGEPVQLRSLDASSPSRSLKDGLRWKEKFQGSLFGCSTYPHPGDARLPGDLVVDQEPSASLGDGPGRSRECSLEGGSADSGGRIRSYPSSGLPSTPGSSCRTDLPSPQTDSTTSKPEPESSGSILQSHPGAARPLDTSSLPRRGALESTLAEDALASTQESLGASHYEPTEDGAVFPQLQEPPVSTSAQSQTLRLTQLLAVQSDIEQLPESSFPGAFSCGDDERIVELRQVESVVSSEYYDFHVPLLENYWAAGVFHHNTGKTLTAKACGNVFGVPLLRLDAAKLFGSLVGQSESNWRAVHATAKAMAPCVLHIDEVDGAMSGSGSSGQSDGGTTARVVKSILQDMQDNSEGIFYVLTANDVDALPAPLLRRMDEVWNVELPTGPEREIIWGIQIAKLHRKPADFNLQVLASKSDQYSGAEIEKIFVQGLHRGFADGRREPTTEDLLGLIAEFSPLSKTMAADIEKRRARLAGVAKLAGGAVKVSVEKPVRKLTPVNGRN